MGSNGAEQGNFSVSARTGSARRQITTIIGLVLGESDVIRLEDLPEKIRDPLPAVPGQDAGGFSFTFPEEGVSLEEAEKAIILEALRRAGWNQSRAALLLKVPRHLLLYRMEKFALPRKPPETL